jgi:hypothetical protein
MSLEQFEVRSVNFSTKSPSNFANHFETFKPPSSTPPNINPTYSQRQDEEPRSDDAGENCAELRRQEKLLAKLHRRKDQNRRKE